MIRVSKLDKIYDGRSGPFHAVRGISFTIEEGEFVTILGPSGCGKTSTLRCIAGLEDPNGGEIEVDRRLFYSSARNVAVPPNKRNLGMVFQSYAIWPHMTVFENVAFPLRVRKRRPPQTEIRTRVMSTLSNVGLDAMAMRQSTELSGGQQQRLALARALVTEPRVLLLDEPLSNLDARLRDQMRGELRNLQRKVGVTTVYVTHDQTEALAMSSRIIIMNEGRIVQQGEPRELYMNPRSRFVADFVGAANFVPGKWRPGHDHNGAADTSCGLIEARSVDAIQAGEDVLIAVRPEDVNVRPARGGTDGPSIGHIESITFRGDQVDLEIRLGEFVLRARQHAQFQLQERDPVHVGFPGNVCVALRPGG